MKTSKLVLALGMLTFALVLPVNAGELTIGKNAQTRPAHVGDTLTYDIFVCDPNAIYTLTVVGSFDVFAPGTPDEVIINPVPGFVPNFILQPDGDPGGLDCRNGTISFLVTEGSVIVDANIVPPNVPVAIVRNVFHIDGINNKPTPVTALGEATEDVRILDPNICVTKTVEPTFSKVGDTVTYTIEICNCGDADLTLTEIVDSLLGPIDIPPECSFLEGGEYVDINPDPAITDYQLQPGGCCSFTIDYVIQPDDPDPLVNEVCVTAVDIIGGPLGTVSDCDDAVVDLVIADLTVEKVCPPVDISKPGDDVCYDVNITNTGEVDLLILDVNDSLVGPLPACIGVILAPGQSCLDSYCYTVMPGDPDPLVNKVEVVAEVVTLGNILERESNECSIDLVNPGLLVEKDCPPYSKVGDEVCNTITITNTGDTPIEILDVLDTIVGPLFNCIGVVLAPGEHCDDGYCYEVPPGAPNPIENEVFVIAGVVGLPNIIDANALCETGLVNPSIDLEKTVDNNEPCYGDTVTYTICIENTGDVILENIVVNDPFLGGDLAGFPPVLAPGEVWCEDFTYVVQEDDPCPLENCATVTSNPLDLPNVIDANDCTEICPQPCGGGEGCTPGFWKNNGDKHGASAWCDRFSPSMKISDVFILNEPLVIRGNGKSTITNPTLLQALGANGGGVNAMIRHGIAAMLNACSDCVQYEYSSPDQVISMIEDALNGVGPYTVDELHYMFAKNNEAGCPVNQQGECVGVED